MSSRNFNVPIIPDLTITLCGARLSRSLHMIVGLAKEGVTVIVVISDLEDILGISHRSLVLSEGRQTADVTEKGRMIDAVTRTERELGPLSVAVNAAGIADANPAEEMEIDQWQTMVDGGFCCW